VSGLAAAGVAVGIGVAVMPWEANPFFDTTAIVVQHGTDTYRVDDAKEVKELVDAIVIDMVKNGSFLASVSTATLTFERGQKKDPFVVQLSPDGAFMIEAGTMDIHPVFIRFFSRICG
jgi:hypothetical protein